MTDRGVSPLAAPNREVLDLYRSFEIVDLHTESFSWTRSFGYDLGKRHRLGWNRGLLFGQADFPRLKEAGIGGAIHSVTANPLRPVEDRSSALEEQLRLFADQARLADVPVVRTLAEYRAARRTHTHVAFLGVQGASVLPRSTEERAAFLPSFVKVCLLHLTNNEFGRTSTWPLSLFRRENVSPTLPSLVGELESARVLVDLAHLHPDAVRRVLDLAAPDRPLLVSHTAMNEVHRHFRNLDDESARRVAERGGLVGILYHSLYLGDGLFGGRIETLVRHIEHAWRVVGVDHVALGSDWDGLICPPEDLRSCLELPRLLAALVERGHEESALRKLFGENFLRLLGEVRP